MGPVDKSWDGRRPIGSEILEIVKQFPQFVLSMHVGGNRQHRNDGVGTQIGNRLGAFRPNRIIVHVALRLIHDAGQSGNG